MNNKFSLSADVVNGVGNEVEISFCVPKEIIANNSQWLPNSLVGTVRWKGVK